MLGDHAVRMISTQFMPCILHANKNALCSDGLAGKVHSAMNDQCSEDRRVK
jgi:hypothetical protein